MTESSWESTRSAQKKRVVFGILIVLPFLLIFVILFINNRDLITKNNNLPPSPELSASSVKTAPAEKKTGTTTLPEVSSPMVKTAPLVETNKVNDTMPLLKKKQEQPLPSKEVKGVSATVKKSAPPIKKEALTSNKLLSEQLPPIDCSILSRKDIVISLSLELFFTDEDTRATILLYRDDIKVMVLRSVRNKELSEMKIHTLETLLLKNINSIFDHNHVTNLKISNIKVEKADR